jgi:hypothetical protein
MHQASRLLVRKLLRNGHISVEILDQNLEIAIQLEKGEAGLVQM